MGLSAPPRRLIAATCDGGAKRRAGRPGVMMEIRQLTIRMSIENGIRGNRRIREAMASLDHRVWRSTVKRILSDDRHEAA